MAHGFVIFLFNAEKRIVGFLFSKLRSCSETLLSTAKSTHTRTHSLHTAVSSPYTFSCVFVCLVWWLCMRKAVNLGIRFVCMCVDLAAAFWLALNRSRDSSTALYTHS